MTDSTTISEQATAIRTVLLGTIISEYGLRSIGNQKQELKFRVNNAIKKCLEVQSYFENSPKASEETKKTFKTQFRSNELYLITEIMAMVYGLNENDLETILEGLRKYIQQ